MILLHMFSLARWTTLSIWMLADASLHGSLRPQHLWVALFLPLVSFPMGILRERSRRAGGHKPDDIDAVRVGSPLAGVVLFALLTLATWTLELTLRERPDGSTLVLLASLMVHAFAAWPYAACSAGLRFQRALESHRPSTQSPVDAMGGAAT